MTLGERIASELKEAMKAKDQVRIDTLRSALSAFSYKKIEAGRAALLPAQKSAEDIRPAVRAALATLPPDQRNQGAAMKLVMPGLKGETDGSTIRQVVLEELGALQAVP